MSQPHSFRPTTLSALESRVVLSQITALGSRFRPAEVRFLAVHSTVGEASSLLANHPREHLITGVSAAVVNQPGHPATTSINSTPRSAPALFVASTTTSHAASQTATVGILSSPATSTNHHAQAVIGHIAISTATARTL